MTEGFENENRNLNVTVNEQEVGKLIKKYKKIKKYMRSPLFAVKTMDGTEQVVSELLKEFEENSGENG
jgi:predicted RNA-binding protein YlqC (UPF0109 family)